MRLKEIIRAPKDKIEVGTWQSGKVPKADFPIARSAYRLGNSFKWCVIRFEALGVECRVLIVQHEAKQKYEAILGVMGANGLRILCSYEYHASEPGWHCHATHDDVSTLSQGAMRGPWIRRVPGCVKFTGRKNTKPLSLVIKTRRFALRFAVTGLRKKARCYEQGGPLQGILQ